MSAPPAASRAGAGRRRLVLRLVMGWRRYRWGIVGALLIGALLVAFAWTRGDVFDRLDGALRILPVPNRTDASDLPMPVRLAYYTAVGVFLYASYQAVFALFGERLQEAKAALARGHTVVCGLGAQGQALIESLGPRAMVVGIELDVARPAIRRLRDDGRAVLVGDAADPHVARKARIGRARYVICTCGDDAVNAQIAANVLAPRKSRGQRPVDVFVHVSDPRLYVFLLHHVVAGGRSRLEFFNIYERGARALVHEAERTRNDGMTSVLVAGAGQLGLALVSHLARTRYENGDVQGHVSRLRVHVVDRQARERIHALRDRYRRLDAVCELQPHEVDVDSPEFDHLLERDHDLRRADVAFVCFDNDARAVAVTLNLLDQAQGRFPVLARVSDRTRGIAAMIEDVQSRYADATVFRPISLAETACRGDLVLEGLRGQLARRVHELYRAGNQGGPYDVPWEQLPDEGRERNVRHAARIGEQLEAVGYRLGPRIDWGAPVVALLPMEIDRMAEMEHERWVEERVREGWRHGPLRDESRRTHPDLIPWTHLSADRREINRRLVTERPAMLARVGIEIYRA